MFSLFWNNVSQVKNLSEIRPKTGQANVIGTMGNNFIRCGILCHDGSIVYQTTPQSLKNEGSKIVSTPLADFVGNGELWQFHFDPAHNAEATLTRALNAIGQEQPSGIFSVAGDDFAHWCITGDMMVPPFDDQVDNQLFGEHFRVPFEDNITHILKAYHHGIGIENGHIIEFANVDSSTKIFFSEKAVKYAPFFETFNQSGKAVRYEYKGLSGGDRLAARNRAVNALLSLQFGRYSLLFKNCEHLAYWCKTGTYRSEQIDNLLGSVGLVALSGISVVAGKPNPIGLLKGVRKFAGKHLKLPWKDLR